jgi:hypothetical protein
VATLIIGDLLVISSVIASIEIVHSKLAFCAYFHQTLPVLIFPAWISSKQIYSSV